MESLKKITGHCVYKGILAHQDENVFQIFESFLLDIKPKRILEIGTAAGGFTLFLRDTLDKLGLQETKIKTFEINRQYVVISEQENLEIIGENIFDHSYMNLTKPELVAPYIQEQGTTLILCDGGYKITEFNELSNFMKVGDFIMAHDYSPNKEYFENHINNKIWLWCEIEDKYIQDAFVRNNLVSYNQEEFQKVVWLCKKKIENE